MPRSFKIEQRTGPRYLASFMVRAEWDTREGSHITEEGQTENVGPQGTLIHLNRLLPDVGSHVRLIVMDEDGQEIRVLTEVLRIERNAAHPQAALMLVDASEEWRGKVWEPTIPRPPVFATKSDHDDDEDGELAL